MKQIVELDRYGTTHERDIHVQHLPTSGWSISFIFIDAQHNISQFVTI